MNRGPRLVEAISDRTNPIVVKESRQAVQSRLVLVILMLFLLANVLIVSGVLIFSQAVTTEERTGQNLFDGLFVVLVGTSMIFVPLSTAIRLTTERNDSNIDLLFITTIPPAAIIRGKFWAAVALTGLIYSASAPFLTFTYLLGGIDLPSIFFALAVAFLTTALVTMLAIFVGSIPGGLVMRVLMFGILLQVGGTLTLYTITGGLAIAEMGLASMFRSSEAWGVFLTMLLIGLCALITLYLLAVAAVSPRSSNRLLPVRVFVTISWLIFGVIAWIFCWQVGEPEPVLAWTGVSVVLLSVALGFILGERESWTPRVRRNIPRESLPRLLAWMFFTGSAGGLIWSTLLAVLTLMISYTSMHVLAMRAFPLPHVSFTPQLVTFDRSLATMLGILLYAWCYAMSGLFLRRLIAPKSAPPVGTAFALLLLGLAGTLPLLVAYLALGPVWQFDSMPISFVIANPFVLGRPASELPVVYDFLLVWAVLGLVANLAWFIQQWRAFERHEPKPAIVPPSLASQPPVVHA